MNTVVSTILSLVISQMNPTVGDIEGNLEKMISHAISARDNLLADIVIFPESSIVGYPPKDFIDEESYYIKISQAVDELKKIKGIAMVVGIVNSDSNQIIVINNGTIVYEYISEIPEKNKYTIRTSNTKKLDFFKYKNSKIGFLIGDHIENNNILPTYKINKIDLLISFNAPVFHIKNYNNLIEYAKEASELLNSPVVCSCLVGAQDKFIFTGGSFAIDKNKNMIAQANYLKEQLLSIEFIQESKNIVGKISDNPEYNSIEMLYNCLVTSLHDYVHKNGFNKVVLGVSGGVDSALAATIATDALGKDNIISVMMPYNYTSSTSIDLAEKLANYLKIKLKTITIDEIYNVVADKIIKSCNLKIKSNTDSRNLQARSRALLLMTIANTHKALVINTVNKSEIATGYFTIYGDGIGGFAVLADVFKTIVYELASYRNKISKAIPADIITREPTAEFYDKQLDRDDIPQYKILDKIIEMHLQKENIDNIATEIYQSKTTIQKILNMINNAEYKRNQAPIGPLVEPLGFDTSFRNYPITNKWKY